MKIGEIILPRATDHSSPPTVALGPWGVLEVEGRAALLIRDSRTGVTERYATELLLQDANCVHYALDTELGCLLLLNAEGKYLLLLDLASRRLATVTTLARWRDPDDDSYDPGGLYRVRMFPAGGDVVIEYECGVLLVSMDGRVRWRREHTCFSTFAGIDSGVAWFEGGDEEGLDSDERWGYRLEDGSRVIPVRA